MNSNRLGNFLSAGFLSLGLAILTPPRALADVNVFLTYDGLPGCGSSAVAGYAGQIVVRSFGQTVDHPTSDSGLPSGNTESRSIQISKDLDKCSPLIFLDAVSGRIIANMTISFVTAGPEPFNFAKIEATNVQIVNMSLNEPSPPSALSERLSFAIGGRLQVTYREQRPDGTVGSVVVGCWDFKQKAAC